VQGTLVIHDSTFDTNTAGSVSEGVVVSKTFLTFLLCPGGGHATFRVVELFLLHLQLLGWWTCNFLVPMWRSMIAPSNTAYNVKNPQALEKFP
jgi:hypothetical protein